MRDDGAGDRQTTMYFIVTAAWIVVTAVSWIQLNRKMPITIGVLGLLAHAGIWIFGIGYWGIAALAILTVIGMTSVPEIFMGGKV